MQRLHHTGIAVLFQLVFIACCGHVFAQEIPSKGENIDFLETFGSDAEYDWGDDDHSQTFFFFVPESHTRPISIRVFDPDISGKHDMRNEEFDTELEFSIYGGEEAYTHPDARLLDPTGFYKSGTLLHSQKFGADTQYDDQWVTLGTFNPVEGEYVEAMKGYVFKVIAEGVKGDDGNLYRYFLSQDDLANVPVVQGNGFTYEYSFRLKSEAGSIAHIYPFVGEKVVSIYQNNFDFDSDGYIRVYSVIKNGHHMKTSSDSNWGQSNHKIGKEEIGKSLNIQIIKRGKARNDMVFYVTNQYKEPMPFFAIPIGGPPKYKYDISLLYEVE